MFEVKFAARRGKLSDKWASYIPVYERVLAGLPGSPRILEVGVQNGGSLELWALCCPDATQIVGCDVNPLCASLVFDDPRITVVVGDANNADTESRIALQCPQFDLVIDDGSHRSSDLIRTFAGYFPRLSDGGVYVAEDLHCSYWDDFEGGLLHPASPMAFFKRLADVVNHEHWGVAGARGDLLVSFSRRYGVNFEESALAHVHSVEFVNSMCIVRRRAPVENSLGLRRISGSDATVDAGSLAAAGTRLQSHDQRTNRWSALQPLPEDELQESRNRDTENSHRQRQIYAQVEAREAEVRSKAQEIHRLAKVNKELSDQLKLVHAQYAQVEACEAEVRSKEQEIHQLAKVNKELSDQLKLVRAQLVAHEEQTHEILTSTSWRLGAPVRLAGVQKRRAVRLGRLLPRLASREGGFNRLLRRGVSIFRESGVSGIRGYLREAEAGRAAGASAAGASPTISEAAALEIFGEQQNEFSRDELLAKVAELRRKPLISVVMPIYKTPPEWLARVIESLREQVYPNWELCAVDDHSPTDEQRQILEAFAVKDPRVRFQVAEINGGISAASNRALSMARGEYVALVDHDDELTPDAFYWVAKTLEENPEADFIYSDECKIDDTPQRRLSHFIFKPDWSPEIMFNGMITGHLTVYEKSLMERIGGFRTQYDFSQDYDLAFRASERARHVVHIERVLYLWRTIPGSAASGGKDFARESNLAALGDFLARNGIDAKVSALSHANCVEVQVPAGVKVSIVIPSDSYANLKLAIQSILERTAYVDFEIVAVCNSPLADRLQAEYAGVPQVVFSCYDKKYNFSEKCNQGAGDASGEIAIFYNDDVFPIESDWINKLIEYLWVPGVGAVSPKLLHADDSIQYAGMISGTPGLCGTAYNHVPRDANDGFLSMHKYVRNVSILSGACCAMRRSLFLDVGGFDSINTPDGHSDMDLSYKIMDAGYRCVYTPYAVLHHIGNHSWGAKKDKYKADIFVLKRWGRYVSRDANFTDSMKRVLYDDFRFNYKIHAAHLDPALTYSGPDVLFVSHELSLTGAPRMLFYAAKAVLERGGFPVVVSPKDGPLRDELIAAGVAVIIDESVPANHFLFGGFARNFDAVVVNTIELYGVVRQLQAVEDLRLIWWIHEAQSLAPFFDQLQEVGIGSAQLVCVSGYARRFVPDRYRSDVLHNAVPDASHTLPTRNNRGVFTFVLTGTIEPRKGQDLFAEAILLLPRELRRACRFVIVGKLWEMRLPYWNAINKKAGEEIEYLGLLGHQEALALMNDADVIVCPSRDEPSSLAVIEGAMLAKPAIVSANVGVAEMFTHGSSCLEFEANSAASLAQQLKYAIEHPENMKKLGAAARRVYEREFDIRAFTDRLMRLINKV